MATNDTDGSEDGGNLGDMAGLAGDDVDPRYIVPGLTRGLALLMLFTRDAPAWSISELAKALSITRSAVYRIAYTLEKAGFLRRDSDGRQFRLTPKILSLGFEYLNSISPAQVAPPFLRELSARTSTSAYLSLLEGWQTVYVVHVSAGTQLISSLQVGSRQPAHVTASGRVLLGGLDQDELARLYDRLVAECTSHPVPASFDQLRRTVEEDRERGYVFHHSLIDRQVASCACPVFNGGRKLAAAVTAIGARHHIEAIGGEAALHPAVGDAARGISRQLGLIDGQARA